MSDFARFPHTEVWDRVELQVGDMHTTLDTLCAQGRTIDVITVYGVFYHIMDHFSFLRKLMALKPASYYCGYAADAVAAPHYFSHARRQ